MFASRKQIGEWAEMQFMARAAANGFTVTKPWGDSVRYDFAVEKNGQFQRVQVKSTASRDGSSYACNVVWSAPQGRSRKYTPQDIDFFAILVIPEETWYVIPIAELKKARSTFYLDPRSPKNRYFRYREAWQLLDETASRRQE